MERLYQDYKDIAHFYLVYISEAHAEDDSWPVPYAKELGIKEHKTYGERCSVASRLLKDKKLTIPCLVDDMKNTTDGMYHGWPDRVFLVRTDGKLAVAGKRGPWGFKPGISATKRWLKKLRDTGHEPPIDLASANEPDVGQMQQDLNRAYVSKDYKGALKVALELHKLSPRDSGNMYNIACFQSLLKNESLAYDWLGKAIDAGYRDADHLAQDDDFSSIRDQDRFQQMVQRTRAYAESDKQPPTASTVAGQWDMQTDLNGNMIDATMTLEVKEGKLVGTWESQGRTMDLIDPKLDGRTLTFQRSVGGQTTLTFEGTFAGNALDGHYSGGFGKLTCKGKRKL